MPNRINIAATDPYSKHRAVCPPTAHPLTKNMPLASNCVPTGYIIGTHVIVIHRTEFATDIDIGSTDCYRVYLIEIPIVSNAAAQTIPLVACTIPTGYAVRYHSTRCS